MAEPIDLTGHRYGRLLVLGPADPEGPGRWWSCRCDCGRAVVKPTRSLRSGWAKSCGCLFLEVTKAKGRAKKIDLTGRRFGRLVVEDEAGRNRKGQVRWRCRCDCGGEHEVIGSILTRGGCLSCGCLRDELLRARAAVVGAAESVRACETCGRIYTAVGPQKRCSDECRRRHHADDEARRRERAEAGPAAELEELKRELQRRSGRGHDGD